MPRAIQLAIAAIVSFAPVAALADPTAEQAQALQQQVRHWVETTVGLTPAFLNDISFRVAPEGDHYRLSLRLGAMPLFSGMQDDEVSVAAQMLPAGQWLLFDYRLATPMRLRIAMPNTGGAAAEPWVPIDMLLRFGKIGRDAMIDPSFKTPSVASTTTAGFQLAATSAEMRQRVDIDQLAGHASLIPLGGGRVDIRDDAAAEDVSVAMNGQGAQQSLAAFAGRVEVNASIAGLLPEAVAALVQAFTEPPAGGGMAAQERDPAALLRVLYSKLRGIATGGAIHETLEDVRGEMGGHIVGIGRATYGWSLDASNNILTANLDFGVDGIASPDIPPQVRPYVPRHVLVRQTLSGIDLGDLDALIQAAIAQGPNAKIEQPEIAERMRRMFTHGGITAALDALEVDVGATHFAATGQVTALSLDHVKGQGRVSATGFEALIAQVRTSPEWGKVAPFLQLLGMIGRREGERIVWTIASDNKDVSVNGLDIPALIAAGQQLEKH